jgi:PKD repeat protein
VLLIGLAGPAAAAVYEVNAAAACPGAGTALAPFCSIGSAAAVAAPGDVVNVARGVYREQVSPPASGADGLPIIYRGARGAKILGTDDLSGAARWTLAGGTTWVTPYDPDTNPAQVFVDREALTAGAVDASTVPAHGFFYDAVAALLYVNLGGDHPGRHRVQAGARSFGFAIEGRSHLVVEGFVVRGHNTNGIRVRGSSHVVIRNNRVARAASFGLVVDGGSSAVEVRGNALVGNGDAGLRLRTNVTQATVAGNRSHHNANHGFLIGETTASVFSGNVLYANARPGGASTTGLMLAAGSIGNRVERNLAWENQDTGFQVSGGADDNLLVRNVSYANGDHGFDVRECDGARLVSNTAWANVNDGFSIEGNVTNATLRNNIGSDNGLFTNGNDLWVDASSTVGFSADYDVFHRSLTNGNSIDYAGAEYTNVADFAAATGHEQHGSSANPQFADPADGDFHPGLGPALDSADASASGFQALDFDGLPPIDLAGVANTGAGVPDFADRGALERADAAPVAKLRLAPKKGAPGVVVAADGSGSSDDIGIVSYRFAWGDGTPDTVQAGPVATHSFTESGHYKVKLTVTDTAGQTDVHQQPVNVKAPKLKPVKGKPHHDKPAKGKAKGKAKSRHAKAR